MPGIFFGTSFRITIKPSLRRTLVLFNLYSAFFKLCSINLLGIQKKKLPILSVRLNTLIFATRLKNKF